MFAIVLALVFSKLPIGWKQVFKHFTGVLELGVGNQWKIVQG